MVDEWLMLVVGALLGAYGVWGINHDLNRGRASARGFGFDRATQPRRYRALMVFNCIAVGLLFTGAIVSAATLISRAIS